MFSCEFYEIFKNKFFNRTPPVAPSWLSTLKKIKNILSNFSLLRFAVHNRKLNQEMYFDTACLLYGAMYRAL